MAQTRDDRLVIGLTGPFGNGVSTVAESLERHGRFKRISISKPIKEELIKEEAARGKLDLPLIDKTWNETSIPDFRKKLQDIGNQGRRQRLSHWVEKALAEVSDVDSSEIVIDGIRNFGEVAFLRDTYPKFFLVAVHVASEDVRWERVQGKYNRDKKLFDRDNERDKDEDDATGQQVGKCVSNSDFVMLNDNDTGSAKEHQDRIWARLEQELELMRAVDKIGNAPRARNASSDEVSMATAYAQSHNSQCLKRHVGALIVDEDGLPISLGFNENPIGMLPCRHLYNYCFKDADMHRKLEAMAIEVIYCRRCSKKVEEAKEPWRCGNCGSSLKTMFFPSRNMELCTAIHAEERAIRSLNGRSAARGTIYTTTFPCFQCARYIVDAKIRRVVYVEAYPVKEAEAFLKLNKVEVVPFSGFKARAFNRVFKQME